MLTYAAEAASYIALAVVVIAVWGAIGRFVRHLGGDHRRRP